MPIDQYSDVILTLGQHSEIIQLSHTTLKHYSVILGIPWLRSHNPLINWEAGILTFQSSKKRETNANEKAVLEPATPIPENIVPADDVLAAASQSGE